MANKTIRRGSLWVNNNKVIENENLEFTFNTNGERAHGQEGILGAGQGNVEVEIRVNAAKVVEQEAGLDAIEQAMNDQTDVVCVYKQGASVYQVACRVQQGTFSTDSRSGGSKCSFNMMSVENPKKIA